jgi:hypothetical protein
MTHTLALIAQIGAHLWMLHTAWVALSFAMYAGFGRSDATEWVWLILKWPALVIPLLEWADGAIRHTGPPWANALVTLFYVGVWWLFRNTGDDDWRKRQRRRLAAKVKAAGHRLVVVPAPVGT